jgi:hypothetical protein
MEPNIESIHKMALIENESDFEKTLSKLVPKSEFITETKNRKSIIGSQHNTGLAEFEPENVFDSSQSQISQPSVKKNQVVKTEKINKSKTAYPRKDKLNKILRKLNNEYINQIKETDVRDPNFEDLKQEINFYTQKINEVKRTNRDEDLLKMQKENQSIELKLKEMKNRDKSELRRVEEESKQRIERLNALYHEKKKEAVEKDEERTKIIEEIKQIKKNQIDHKNQIENYKREKDQLTNQITKLEKDIEKLKEYQVFIDRVFESSNQSQNDGFTKLSNKFKELIESMETIKNDIENQEKEIKEIATRQKQLLEENDKQKKNKKLVELESEIKKYTEENKILEKEIEEIQKRNQKKDSDTYQIKLSINNLYMKCKYKESDELKRKHREMKENQLTSQKLGKKNLKEKNEAGTFSDWELCNQLTEINERIADLIQIYKTMEKEGGERYSMK